MTRTGGEGATISGQMNESQLNWKRTNPKAISAGAAFGRTTRQKAPNSEQPSMRAASSSSRGKPRKNWRRRNMPSGLATKGMISAWYVSTQWNARISMYSGIASTSNGMTIVARKMTNSTSRPGNRMRAKTYAALLLTTSEKAVTTKATNKLLNT